MSHDIHHEHLIKELSEELEPIFSQSPQAIYLYLDDAHKSCNQKFADMLGYKSVEEWVKNEYPIEDVIEEDRDKAIEAYMNASEKFTAATLSATWTKKDGKKIKTQVTMVPLTYKNETFVLHFITQK
jgi:PAS domain S-box-containing protein